MCLNPCLLHEVQVSHLHACVAHTGTLFAVGISVTVFGTPLQVLSGYLIGLEVRQGEVEVEKIRKERTMKGVGTQICD